MKSRRSHLRQREPNEPSQRRRRREPFSPTGKYTSSPLTEITGNRPSHHSLLMSSVVRRSPPRPFHSRHREQCCPQLLRWILRSAFRRTKPPCPSLRGTEFGVSSREC